MRLAGTATHLHADTPMPEKPRRQRHESPRRGDNRGAIRRARGGYLDLNVTYSAQLDDLLAAHSPHPWRDGYRFVDKPGGGRRRMRGRERFRTIDQWARAGRRPHQLSRKNGERLLTLDRALDLCVEYGTVPVKETKSRAFARSDRPWRLLRRECVDHDVPTWCKALVTMFGFKSKVIRAERCDVPLAAIYGKGLRGRARRLARTRRIERGWRDGTKVHRTW